jgi:hypothetical protein
MNCSTRTYRLLTYVGALGFSLSNRNTPFVSAFISKSFGNHRVFPTSSRSISSLKGLASSGDLDTTPAESFLENLSTLTLIEHINLNVPNHDYILDFYLNVLGFGLDPRRAQNVNKGNGTVWCNAGASQFHLPYGEEAQVIPGSIGLWYDSLDALKERLANYDDMDEKPFAQYSIESEGDERESVRIMDNYGNVFYCRKENVPILFEHNDSDQLVEEMIRTTKQPILTNQEDDVQQYAAAATTYGLGKDEETECKGISYVEIFVPRKKAAKLAEFYECVFDAPATVFTDPSSGDDVAIVGFGSIDPDTGRSSQTLLFRESDIELPPYDGHHIALYVGTSKADFEEAFKNVLEAQVVWVNPRFSDRVTNMNTAKKWKQFRFKNLTDLKTGKKIIELEHEVRSVEHDAWPGN